jgi:hypothetical protein
MNKDAWIRGIEIVVILPATVYLAPMAAFSALGTMFAVVQDVRLGLFAELMLIGMMVSFLAATVGMVSLWMAMTVPSDMLVGRRNLRVALVIGIIVGIADACYWLRTIGHQRGTPWNTLCIWLLLLAGPIVVGARHALRLARLGTKAHRPDTTSGI